MSNHRPGAFFSYTRFDDRHSRGHLTRLCEFLGDEVQAQTGEPFRIFLDRKDIGVGQGWRQRIKDALDAATLLIAIISPKFFQSKECRSELSRFLERERQLRRDDLILPIHFIEAFSSEQGPSDDPLVELIASRQTADWRDLRFEAPDSDVARKKIAELASQVTDTLRRIGNLTTSSRNFPDLEHTDPDPPAAEPDLHDVFKTAGQPTITYVERDKGRFEQELGDALDNRGRVCLLTGPSKTGKTTLYKKVAESRGLVPLTVSCHEDMALSEIMSKALDRLQVIDPSRLNAVPRRGTPSSLLPILRDSRLLLVIEDCHYLKPEVQKTLFQQWKEFVDDEISVIIVGTTRHASSLAERNPELGGRISNINYSNWDERDLTRIAAKGFHYLGVGVPATLLDLIARESAGLPILTQSVCLKLMLNKRRDQPGKPIRNLGFREPDVFRALHDVATVEYSVAYARTYDRLVRGPRGAPKFNTFEMVLGAFGLDPLTFALTREEIDNRLVNWRADLIPPRSAVTEMLNDLREYQDRLGKKLLEWSPQDNTLSIVNPAFLFYLRWRQPRRAEPDFHDIIMEVIRTRKSRSGT